MKNKIFLTSGLLLVLSSCSLQNNVSLVYDNFANILYTTVGAELYSCAFATAPSCRAIDGATFTSASVVGLGIGSSLTN
jgi:hypothetical protein